MARLTKPKRTKKTPKSMRYVGMEIECITTEGWDDDEEFDDYDAYDPRVLGAAEKFVLNCHDDGSVEGKGFPVEVVTQPLLENRKVALKELCKKIKERGGYVNKTCGGHIHVDAADVKDLLDRDDDENIEIALKFLSLCEPALFAVTGKNRLNNTFCQPLSVSVVHQSSYDGFSGEKKVAFLNTNDLFYDRYHSINFGAMDAHGTLEFRLFAGTLEPEKWIARAAFAEAVVNKLLKVLKKPSLLNKMHKNSCLSSVDLMTLIDVNKFNKSTKFKELISSDGPNIIESVGKMVGLRANHRKTLIKQHIEIYGKYGNKKQQPEV